MVFGNGAIDARSSPRTRRSPLRSASTWAACLGRSSRVSSRRSTSTHGSFARAEPRRPGRGRWNRGRPVCESSPRIRTTISASSPRSNCLGRRWAAGSEEDAGGSATIDAGRTGSPRAASPYSSSRGRPARDHVRARGARVMATKRDRAARQQSRGRRAGKDRQVHDAGKSTTPASRRESRAASDTGRTRSVKDVARDARNSGRPVTVPTRQAASSLVTPVVARASKARAGAHRRVHVDGGDRHRHRGGRLFRGGLGACSRRPGRREIEQRTDSVASGGRPTPAVGPAVYDVSGYRGGQTAPWSRRGLVDVEWPSAATESPAIALLH